MIHNEYKMKPRLKTRFFLYKGIEFLGIPENKPMMENDLEYIVHFKG